MAKIYEIIQYIESFAPLSLQGDFDNCGLKNGDTSMEATGVMITLDTNEDVVLEAIAKNCNLIIEHHPSIFHPIRKLDYTLPLIKAISLAIKNDIAIYSAHTNVDFCDGGLNDYVARQLGLKNIRKCGEPCDPRMGETEETTTLREYAEKVSVILKDKNVLTIGDSDKVITKVALVNGGGGGSEADLLCAVNAGADVYVTGDVKYNVARLAKDMKYAIIQVGHYTSEQGFMTLMSDKLNEKFNSLKTYKATSLPNPYN